MANVKEIAIDAVLPFDYLEHLSAAGSATLASWLLAPAVGLSFRWEDVGLSPETNEHGGRTMMYRLRVRGHEAISFPAFDLFVSTLRQGGARIERAECIDVEA